MKKGMEFDLHAALIIIMITLIMASVLFFMNASSMAFGETCRSHVTDKMATWISKAEFSTATPFTDEVRLGKECVDYVTRTKVKFTNDEPLEFKNKYGKPLEFVFTGIAGRLLPRDEPYKVQIVPPTTVEFLGA